MILILPTDTCYGLAGSFTESDYREIYRLKGRDFSKPLALLVRYFDDMRNYIEISDEQIDYLRHYPHPWSFLGHKKTTFTLPSWMDASLYPMLSLRVAEVCLTSDILREIQDEIYPCFLTSANLSGGAESHTLSEAVSLFPGIAGYDGGICDRPPSDIFSLDDLGHLKYIRKNYP